MAWVDGHTMTKAFAQKSYQHGDDLGFTWGETQVSIGDSLKTDSTQLRTETLGDNYQP